MRIHELKYCSTNTYLIEGDTGKILFDTGWAGTFPAFCHAMGEIKTSVQDIDAILISHFHPDHMGITQQIADQGAVLLAADVQRDYIHASDAVFAKEKNAAFRAVEDEKVRFFSPEESRAVLKEFGIDGQIIPTPGHSDDSISLLLDDGSLFVGDLNPLYELEVHCRTQIGDSWDKLLALKPKVVYYGHAKKALLSQTGRESGQETGQESGREIGLKTDRETEEKNGQETQPDTRDIDCYALVSEIMRLIDKRCDAKKIQKKTGADSTFIQDVMRMYLTHRNVGVQGILDRIEIKNR